METSHHPLVLAAALTAACLLVALLWLVTDYVRVLRLRRKLPPGPFPLPLVGNIPQLDKVRPWLSFHKWSEDYGQPIVTFWDGHKPTIVCNDAWSISDLCDKRASIYSTRPDMLVLGHLLDSVSCNQTMLPYGDKWRLHRKLMHAAVGAQVVRNYQPTQGNEARVLLQEVLDEPEQFVTAIERYAISTVSIIGWGRRVSQVSDPVAQLALTFSQGASFALPGNCYTEAIPWLASLPSWLFSFPHQLRMAAGASHKYFFALTKEGASSDNDSFSKRLFRDREEHGLDYKEVATLTGNLVGGGFDTTASTIVSFVLAMCLFPDVQAKAQEELDRVVGRDRMPEGSDMADLPYLSGLINETLRWRPVFVMGGPFHSPIQDDIYQDFLLPKGALVIGNLYSIMRNEREYPDPEAFRPERFVNGLERPYPNKKGINAFGWGRRACSGEPLALQGLFYTMSYLLWAYQMQPGLDEHGREIKLDANAFTTGVSQRPLPFKARFTPRRPDVPDVVRREAASALKNLACYDRDTKITMANAQTVDVGSASAAFGK